MIATDVSRRLLESFQEANAQEPTEERSKLAFLPPSSARAARGLSRPARIRAAARGVVSKTYARARPRSAVVRTGRPVTTSPPCATRSATRASVICCVPPRGTTQPVAWANIPRNIAVPAAGSRATAISAWLRT